MGEVYLATDTRLVREVAVKVLPGKFAHDPERRARFQREARLLASLNHPNIATLYGLEEACTSFYLIMEFIPGQTLAERLETGGYQSERPSRSLARWPKLWPPRTGKALLIAT